MKNLILVSAFSLVALTGCEYTGPSKPSKPHGLSKYKYAKNKEAAKETPGFLKTFVDEKPSQESSAKTTASDATTKTLPNFKGDYLNKLRAKYPMLDTSKIEDKDLMGMLEIYSQELNKIQSRLQ